MRAHISIPPYEGLKLVTSRWVAALLFAFALTLIVSIGQAEAAGPALKLSLRSQPTNFPPGASATPGGAAHLPGYVAVVTNVGTAPTTGTVTFTAQVPASLTALESFVINRNGEEFPCVLSAEAVTCEVSSSSLRPSESFVLSLPVAVAAVGPETAAFEVTVSGGGAPAVSSRTETLITTAPRPFGFLDGPAGVNGLLTSPEGSPLSIGQAGSHPANLNVELGLNTLGVRNLLTETNIISGGLASAEPLRSTKVLLPDGFVVNPSATSVECTEAQLESETEAGGKGCPAASQVGVISVLTSIIQSNWETTPLFNMVPPQGAAASFGSLVTAAAVPIHLLGSVNAAGDYELSASTSDILARPFNPIFAVGTELWGDPSSSIHEPYRVSCRSGGPCPLPARTTALLSAPTSCSSSLPLTAEVSSWVTPDEFLSRTGQIEDLEGNPTGVSGCNALEFAPTISSKATTNLADSPSGLDFNLHQPQNNQLDGLSTAALKDARVTLPTGLVINPSSANGLGACSPAQVGLTTPAGQTSPIHFDEAAQTCPDASKFGTVEVSTPLLDHKLPGAIYLAKPYDNPFANLTTIYLTIEDEETGIVSKLAGKVTSDPSTGQLSATFTENPQLPLEDIDLHFFNGAGAALTTPLTCGTKTTTSDLTPWSTPEGADATPSDSFQTQVAAGGSGTCPSSEANAPNTPAFSAGTIAPQAGAYSPFVLHLSRKDGSQRLTGIDTTLPKGLIGRLAGIPYCSEAQLAQAQSRSNPNQGALEQSNPSCPAASEVGSVEVGAGSGPTPTYVSGHAYLAGPYKGAPLSLAVIVPAVAGPFDLGTVVVRNALYVNPETAQIHAVSDPFPSIIAGIPLDLRSVALKMDRPDFTLNPTSCDPMSLTGSATALTGQSATLSSPFQVGGCSALKFSPKLKISLKGGTKRHRFPALKAVLTYPKGNYANIASAQVTLPHSAFLEQSHIGTVCTRVQFAADACPKASIYGKAKAITPLLDQPLEGPVYLRSSSHELPDLVAALNGQIDVDLVGRIDTGKGGGIRNTFEAVPDAPVSKFVLEMKGGKKGLLVNSEDICRKPQRATVSFTGQNGKASDTTPLIANSCGGKAKKKGGKKGSHAKKGGKGK
jgi:hypothetical protein